MTDQSKSIVDMELEAIKDSQRWFPSTASDFEHHALALAGETGELCNVVKKIQRGSLDHTAAGVKHSLAMELVDVFTYTLVLAGLLHIDLEAAYYVKRTENEQRFGKFKPEPGRGHVRAVPTPDVSGGDAGGE